MQHRLRIRIVVMTGLFTGLLPLAGCGYEVTPAELQAVHVGSITVIRETRGYSATGIGGTGVGGRLVVLPQGCLGAGTGPHRFLVAWPVGTTITGTGRNLAVHLRGRTVRLGESFESGWAGAEPERAARQQKHGDITDAGVIPPRCAQVPMVVLDDEPLQTCAGGWAPCAVRSRVRDNARHGASTRDQAKLRP